MRVRIELPNPDLALLPDMYADVEIATGSDETWWRCPLAPSSTAAAGRWSLSTKATAASNRATSSSAAREMATSKSSAA